MSVIHLTQKLQKEIGMKPADLAQVEETEVPFAEWYAHVFLINRKKQVIFVEPQTLFSFSCEDVSRKDLRERLPELFEKGLGKALFVEGASGKLVKAVMDVCRGEIQFAKTQNRRTIGAMNEFVKNHKFSYSFRGWSRQDSDRFNRDMLTRGFPDGSKDYKMPLEVFANVVREKFGLEFEPQNEEFMKQVISGELNTKEIEGFNRGMAHIFEVSMVIYGMDKTRRQIIRDIVVSENKSLAHLAESILDAYDFECDHCFGFYSDIEHKHGIVPAEVYELFVDCPDVEPTCDHARSVEKTKISEVFHALGKQMLFLFDYGDSWEFIISLKEIRPADPTEKLPCVIRSVGDAPLQYPPYEE